ncbi:ABC transporter permease [Bosea robiniae]|jgi:peptide/nickel transport system permease protein|uniref:Peptide/nickel transport system permease protein n=1 Tax=Bosea robiniae TaxID=1036780 RepID=A0ABY0P4T7_9HYPH|nr:ABC transporter permease [Bosea robiniae]SDH24798.1 peptide/nickel transport system permease protein [Bosea robiniae]
MSGGDELSIPPRRRGAVRRFLASQPVGTIGLCVVVLMAAAAAFADWLAPYDPLALGFDTALQPPSMEHLFGTDSLGRDIFSRVIFGARTALTIGVSASLVGCSIGALIGIASAYYGGLVDLIIQRLTDLMLALPIIVLAIVIVAIFGRSTSEGIDLNVIFAIAIAIIPNAARVIRSSALTIVTMPYVEAARASGLRSARIILRHIAPNVAAPFLILVSAYIAQSILLEAALSFLGLGVTEPQPSWGLMLSGNTSDFYREAPWMIVFPGLSITVTVLAFSLVGDSLRDWFDPKFRVR